MAKKNKKNKGQATARPLTAKEYIRTKARQLELGTCYINDNYKDTYWDFIIVTRRHKQGNITFATFNVDTEGQGLTETYHEFNVTEKEFEDFIALQEEGRTWKFTAVPYEVVHNYIYGAIAWAEEAGFPPCSSFEIDQYILEEDTDDVPLIDIEFGKEGKHVFRCFTENECNVCYNKAIQHLDREDFKVILVINKEKEDEEEDEDDGHGQGNITHERFVKSINAASDKSILSYAHSLLKDLDEGSMSYILIKEALDKGADAVRKTVISMSRMEERMKEESKLYPELPYQVNDKIEYPYEAKLSKSLQNVFLAGSPDVWMLTDLPSADAAKIRRMKTENLQMQLISLLMAAIGDYRKNGKDNRFDNLYCAWQLMLKCTDYHCIQAVQGVMKCWLRQPEDFLEMHFGFGLYDIIPDLCAPLFRDAPNLLVDFIKSADYTPIKKAVASTFVKMRENDYIGQEQCVSIYRDLLHFWTEHWEEHRYCCASDISHALCDLMDLHLSELKPEVEKLFTLERAVNPNICGDKDEVMECLLQ